MVGAAVGAGVGAVTGGYNAYKDSGGDWSETWEGAGKGAIQGGLAGGAAGLCAGGGIWAMAACAGAGNAAGGYLNSLIWGDDYGWSDAGKDFAWGAGLALGGGAATKFLGKLFAKTKAVQWLEHNVVRHLPAKLRGQYKCPPAETPSPSTGAPKAASTSTPSAKSGPAASNYRGRYNADLAAKGQPRLPKTWDAHHRIPQMYRPHAEFKNFDFDAPMNIRGIAGNRVGKGVANIHSHITTAWNGFAKSNPNASRKQIEKFAVRIDAQFEGYWWR